MTKGPEPGARAPRLPSPSRLLLAGAAVVLAVAGGLGLWASVAHLESALIVEGTIEPQGGRVIVRVADGGRIVSRDVAAGDAVAAGDTLLRLADAELRAALAGLRERKRVESARAARLRAERDGAQAVTFSPWLAAQAGDPRAARLMESQRRLFATRRDAFTRQKAILDRHILQYEDEITALYNLMLAADSQLATIEREQRRARSRQGYADDPDAPYLLSLERKAASIEGERSWNEAQIARAEQGIVAAELELRKFQDERRGRIGKYLARTENAITAIDAEIVAAESRLRRAVVVSPIAGTIIDLPGSAPGAVVPPGAPVVEIMPADAMQIVVARIAPRLIGLLAVGQQVVVRPALRRGWSPLAGALSYLSADSIVDPATGRAYFDARVTLAEQAAWLRPGMPVEIAIPGDARPVLGAVAPVKAGLGLFGF